VNHSKTVLITGASGGLGQSLVRIFNNHGFRLIATDIVKPDLTDINGIPGIFFIQADVTDSADVARLKAEAALEETGIDILICAAGIYDTYPVTEADPALFRHMIEVNVLGTVNMVQGMLNPLIKNKGRVIVVSSESYKIQALFQPYMITKASLEAYCLSARQELSLKDVSLTVIRPGAINTPLLNWMKNKVPKEMYPVFGDEFEAGYLESLKLVGKLTPPDVVAGKIFKAAISRNPKRVYRINNNPLLRIASLLPGSVLEKIIKSKFS